jgi:hypothetical protein
MVLYLLSPTILLLLRRIAGDAEQACCKWWCQFWGVRHSFKFFCIPPVYFFMSYLLYSTSLSVFLLCCFYFSFLCVVTSSLFASIPYVPYYRALNGPIHRGLARINLQISSLGIERNGTSLSVHYAPRNGSIDLCNSFQN